MASTTQNSLAELLTWVTIGSDFDSEPDEDLKDLVSPRASYEDLLEAKRLLISIIYNTGPPLVKLVETTEEDRAAWRAQDVEDRRFKKEIWMDVVCPGCCNSYGYQWTPANLDIPEGFELEEEAVELECKCGQEFRIVLDQDFKGSRMMGTPIVPEGD